jgi:hypothetical protein
MKENRMPEEDLEPEYDFSEGSRGKFYREGLVLRAPVYLELSLQNAVQAIDEREGKVVDDIVNELVREQLASRR